MIGQILGHYRIVEKIGSGGMGVVYRAHDERLDRDVALKVLPAGMLADEAARKRFRKEALALSKLNHPNIETVHDFDTQEGVDFLVMEFIPGVTLSEKLAGGPLPEKEVARLGGQLADGLAAAHDQGVVHRDLKPGNLRLTPDGRLKILDFGLARLLRPASDTVTAESLTETVAGTLPYMAPEQLQGEPVDTRTDIYAAGTVLYEMATGQRPFPETQGPRLIDSILHRPLQPPSVLNRRTSPGLESILFKALEKDPENRYQSARELLVDLRRLSVPFSARGEKLAKLGWQQWQLAALGAVAVIVVLLTVLLRLNVVGSRDRLMGRSAPETIRSLAVLPLENLSGDPAQDYFTDGMTEELITTLGKTGTLHVTSRTSVMQYKGARQPLGEIAKKLNVDAVIEGSVLRVGNRVRITAQLIHGATDKHLWAESYERELGDVLALQNEIAQAIARAVQVQLTPLQQARLAAARPVNPVAYELYLKGLYHRTTGTEEGLRKATEYFQQAIHEDPKYAQAYAGLADCYNLFPFYAGVAPKEAFPKGKTAAAKAIEIDEALAEAHTSLAWARLVYDWDWSGAEEEFKRALELNPSYELAHLWYGLQLAWGGRFEQGLAEVKRARELDPVSERFTTFVGTVLYLARQYDRAIQHLKETLDLHKTAPRPYEWLGLSYVQKGMHREAIAALEEGAEVAKGQWSIAIGRLGYAYALAGQRSQALGVLEQLKALSKRKYVPASDFAVVYLGLGQKDEAFWWLEKAYEERASELVFLKVDPRFDPLRSDPRFQDLLRRMNFPP